MVLKKGFPFFLLLLVYTGLLFGISGCSILKENSFLEQENGKYKVSQNNTKQKSWIQFEDTIIRVSPLQSDADKFIFRFNEISDSGNSSLRLIKSSFDIDVITIPFKYRPSVKEFPNQLNANFSGAIYAGYRNDYFKFHYKKNGLGEKRRKLSHFGFSYGLFTGIGSSAINPWVTLNQISSEYDGFLLMSGVAGLVAVNKITFGVGVGVDHLLDKNRKYWIYHQKPWLGLTVGLNLN